MQSWGCNRIETRPKGMHTDAHTYSVMTAWTVSLLIFPSTGNTSGNGDSDQCVLSL